MEQRADCRRCGGKHTIREHRGVKYYYCIEAERVLLVAEKRDESIREEVSGGKIPTMLPE